MGQEIFQEWYLKNLNSSTIVPGDKKGSSLGFVLSNAPGNIRVEFAVLNVADWSNVHKLHSC